MKAAQISSPIDLTKISAPQGDEKSKHMVKVLRHVYADAGLEWSLSGVWGGDGDCADVAIALFYDLAPMYPERTRLVIGLLPPQVFEGAPDDGGYHYWVEFGHKVVVDASNAVIEIMSRDDYYERSNPVQLRMLDIESFIDLLTGDNPPPLLDGDDFKEHREAIAKGLRHQLTQYASFKELGSA